MRWLNLALLLLTCQAATAELFLYRTPRGHTVFSDRPLNTPGYTAANDVAIRAASQAAKRAECQALAKTSGRAMVFHEGQGQCRDASSQEQATGTSQQGLVYLPRRRTSPSPQPPQPSPPQVRPVPREEPAQPARAVPARTWVDTAKPPMPGTVSQPPLPPDILFKSVQKAVYVLMSAANLQSILAQTNTTQGSAVAVTPRIALTNCHVIHKNRVHVLVREDEVFEARVVYNDESSDRCALEIKSGSLQPVPGIRPYATLTVGERVYTVGSPRGLENTLGEGIISGLRGKPGFDLVQTSAPISPGSSGGGLFDAAGNLIGITTFLVRDAQNLNFAVAADAFWR